MSRAAGGGGDELRCRYKGVRRRRWGKWVSEIRVPGTRERLWLGSYATAEAAAVAHDAAVYLLRRAGAGGLNFPGRAAAAYGYAHGARGAGQLSPRSVQRVASDAGMAADAHLVELREGAPGQEAVAAGVGVGVGVDVGVGVAQGGGAGARDRQGAYSNSTDTPWCTYGDGSRSSCSTGSEQLVYGDLSVDDMEILM